jgi:hypothetical protein
MFGQKADEVIPMGLYMELVVFHQNIELHQIFELEVDALAENQQGSPYDDYPFHSLGNKITTYATKKGKYIPLLAQFGMGLRIWRRRISPGHGARPGAAHNHVAGPRAVGGCASRYTPVAFGTGSLR